MNAPIAEPGNDQAREAAKSATQERRPLGKGHVMGNLTGDPELRYTPSGRAVVRLRLAYTPRVQDGDSGQWSDGPTEYYDVQAWGAQAENAAECLVRGDRVVAAGTWAERTWEDHKGNERKTVELTAQDLGASLLFRRVRIDRSKRTGATSEPA